MTRSQLRRLLENADYWRDRETAQREAYILTEEEEMREVNRIYRDMYRWAEREISAFYGRYADAEGIDITEAKRRVSNLDIERYEELAKKYVADKDFSDRANQEMRLYNATMRINRMELLKAQIGLKLVDGFNDIDKHYEKIATDRAVQELERMSGILGNTLTDVQTAKYARNIVNADFYNANFSERIWSHMDNLRNELAVELQKGFISGVSSQKMAQNIKKQFEVSYKDAHRLVVTELRRVQTDVAKQQYEESDIEEYEYCAVNPRACPICRELDGKVFKVADMKAGENAPPLHPNCHCTTAPKVNEDEYEQWLSWLENGGTTEQWDAMTDAERNRWYDGLLNGISLTMPKPEPQAEPESEIEDEAIEWYVSGDGMWVNQYLRGRTDGMTLTDGEKTLMKALEKATDQPLPKGFNKGKLWRSVDASAIFSGMTELELSQLYDHIVYGNYDKGAYSQGIKKRMDTAIDNIEGATITEKGFMSTTKSKTVAEDWGDFTGADVPVVIEFDTTKTSIKGREIDQKFEIDEDAQEEVLLHPNAKYKVTGIGKGYYDDNEGAYIKINAVFID